MKKLLLVLALPWVAFAVSAQTVNSFAEIVWPKFVKPMNSEEGKRRFKINSNTIKADFYEADGILIMAMIEKSNATDSTSLENIKNGLEQAKIENQLIETSNAKILLMGRQTEEKYVINGFTRNKDYQGSQSFTFCWVAPLNKKKLAYDIAKGMAKKFRFK